MNLIMAPGRDTTTAPDFDPLFGSESRSIGRDFAVGISQIQSSPLPFQERRSAARLSLDSVERFRVLSHAMRIPLFKKSIWISMAYASSSRRIVLTMDLSQMDYKVNPVYSEELLTRISGGQVNDDRDLNIAFRRLENLRVLEENWDTYGGFPPTDAALAKARTIMDFVGTYLGPSLGRAASPGIVAPISNGGILLGWIVNDLEIEAEVDENGLVNVLQVERRDSDEQYDEHEDVSVAEVLGFLQNAANS